MSSASDHARHVAQVMAASGGLGFAAEAAQGSGLRGLLEAVARAHRLTADQVLAPGRAWKGAHARQDLMWRARQVAGPDGAPRYSLTMIARFLGLKDHTTVLWGVRRHQGRLESGR